MKIVVLAHPRSGTRYTAHCFRRAGWDVRQEKIGAHGIASWAWAVESEEVPHGVPRTGSLVADIILHIVREPPSAVSSIMHTEQSSEAWRARWINIPMDAEPLERAVWSLFGWSHLIAHLGPTHRAQLENIEATVKEITGTKPHQPSVIWFNSRTHPRLSADEIKATVWKHEETATLWDAVNAYYEAAA